jgi:hypothetical protein
MPPIPTHKTARKPRRIRAAPPAPTEAPEVVTPAAPSKLATLVAMLCRQQGATLAEMTAATGWQVHSVRGALSGSLKKKQGRAVTSTKADGVRIYRIAP